MHVCIHCTNLILFLSSFLSSASKKNSGLSGGEVFLIILGVVLFVGVVVGLSVYAYTAYRGNSAGYESLN